LAQYSSNSRRDRLYLAPKVLGAAAFEVRIGTVIQSSTSPTLFGAEDSPGPDTNTSSPGGRKIGLGGECPHCAQPVAVTELLAQEVIATD
jgi:hypothetical protein